MPHIATTNPATGQVLKTYEAMSTSNSTVPSSAPTSRTGSCGTPPSTSAPGG